MLFLHGQPGSGSDWRGVIQRLPSDWLVLAPDRPGYRGNRRPAGDFTANARFALSELDDQGLAGAVIVGHSYGGAVALETALTDPHRVRALVLVASVGPGCIGGWDRLLAAPLAGPVCAVAAWWLTPWFARAWIARVERQRQRPLEDDELINWQVWGQARHSHGAMWRTFLTEQRALVRDLDRLIERIPNVTVPTIVLADPADTVVPIDSARGLVRLLPNACLIEVPEAGHHLPRRAPGAVADAITELMNRFGLQ